MVILSHRQYLCVLRITLTRASGIVAFVDINDTEAMMISVSISALILVQQ